MRLSWISAELLIIALCVVAMAPSFAQQQPTQTAPGIHVAESLRCAIKVADRDPAQLALQLAAATLPEGIESISVAHHPDMLLIQARDQQAIDALLTMVTRFDPAATVSGVSAVDEQQSLPSSTPRFVAIVPLKYLQAGDVAWQTEMGTHLSDAHVALGNQQPIAQLLPPDITAALDLPDNRLLIIGKTAAALDEFQQLLAVIDIPQPRVMLEAKLVAFTPDGMRQYLARTSTLPLLLQAGIARVLCTATAQGTCGRQFFLELPNPQFNIQGLLVGAGVHPDDSVTLECNTLEQQAEHAAPGTSLKTGVQSKIRGKSGETTLLETVDDTRATATDGALTHAALLLTATVDR